MEDAIKIIDNARDVDEIIKAAYEGHKRMYTNCFMFADKLHGYAESGRLARRIVPDGLLLLLDMDDYYIIYYYISPDQGLKFDAEEKPSVVEFLEFENRANKQNAFMIPYFEAAGFRQHNVIHRLTAEYDQDKVDRLCARHEDLYKVITARPEHSDEIIEMLLGTFDPVKNLMPSSDDLRASIERGEIFCILDDDGKVICTTLASIEDSFFSCPYTVTVPEWQRKNLSWQIRKEVVLKAWNMGIKKQYGWVLDDNHTGMINARNTGLELDGSRIIHYIK